MQAPVRGTNWRSLNVPARLPERTSVPVLSLELTRDAEQHPDTGANTVTGAAVRARRALMLAVCCLSLFMVGLDNTIVNVGLPSIGRDLHAGVSGLQWTIAGCPGDALRGGRGPDRPPNGLPGRSLVVHPRFVAVQPGPEPRLADRLPDPAGGPRLHAQPGLPAHQHQ